MTEVIATCTTHHDVCAILVVLEWPMCVDWEEGCIAVKTMTGTEHVQRHYYHGTTEKGRSTQPSLRIPTLDISFF